MQVSPVALQPARPSHKLDRRAAQRKKYGRRKECVHVVG
jgi:hypothetical protein